MRTLSVFLKSWNLFFELNSSQMHNNKLYNKSTNMQLEKLPSIEVGPTALAWPKTLNLMYDFDLQSPASASYGRDLLACKISRSKVSRFRR